MDQTSSQFPRNIISENEIWSGEHVTTEQSTLKFSNVPLNERASNIGTDSRHPMQPAPIHAAVSPSHSNENNAKIEKIKPFNEITNTVEIIHQKLKEVVYSASKFNATYEESKKNKEKSNDLSYLKNTSNWVTQGGKIGGAKNLQEINEYKSLKGNRDKTALEIKLHTHSNFRWNINALNGAFRDSNTGLYAELKAINKNEFVLCFPGTGAGQMNSQQWSVNINQFLGKNGVPAAYEQAKELAEEIKTKLEKKGGSLTVAGHSLGGGIANYVGIKLNIESFCFNAAALGGACQQDMSKELTPDRIQKQNHIKQKGDIVAGKNTQKNITGIYNRLFKQNIIVPQNIGNLYTISASDSKDKKTNLSNFERHQLDSFDLLFEMKQKFDVEAKPSQNQFIQKSNNVEKSALKQDESIYDASDNSASLSLNTYLSTPAQYNNLSISTATNISATTTTTTMTTTTTTTTTTTDLKNPTTQIDSPATTANTSTTDSDNSVNSVNSVNNKN
jgi:hypothetical protein